MTTYDWLVVGAGFTGATFAERMAQETGARVLVVDKRSHLGGNAYEDRHVSGILKHTYGPHIFHTNSSKVWSYLSRFTAWRPYFHHVLGAIDGMYVPIPFNLNSVDALFPRRMADRLTALLVEAYGFGAKIPISKMLGHADRELNFLAKFIYESVFRGYTSKQWGTAPELLDESVAARVPVQISRDDRYFQDRWQGIPREGYGAMFSAMLNHPRIDVSLETAHADVPASGYRRLFFTGPIDEFFGAAFGPLPYRSLRFEHVVDRTLGQPVAQINFPNNFDFTRVVDHRWLTGEIGAETLLTYEFPEAYVRGVNDAYYPIPSAASRETLRLYQQLAQSDAPEVVFAGRLGDYTYYNMDQASARALSLAERVQRREVQDPIAAMT